MLFMLMARYCNTDDTQLLLPLNFICMSIVDPRLKSLYLCDYVSNVTYMQWLFKYNIFFATMCKVSDSVNSDRPMTDKVKTIFHMVSRILQPLSLHTDFTVTLQRHEGGGCVRGGRAGLNYLVSIGFLQKRATARQIYDSIHLQRNQNLTSRSINPCSKGKMSL